MEQKGQMRQGKKKPNRYLDEIRTQEVENMFRGYREEGVLLWRTEPIIANVFLVGVTQFLNPISVFSNGS